MRAPLIYSILCTLVSFLPARAQQYPRVRKADSLVQADATDKARSFLRQALPGTTGREAGLLTGRLASLDIQEGNFDAAEQLLRNFPAAGTDLFTQALLKSRAGFLYLNKARSDLAEQSLLEAQSLFNQAHETKSDEAALCMSYLSLVYLNEGKTNQALEHAELAKQMKESLYGPQAEETAAAYNDLGLVYAAINPETALEYYEKAADIYRTIHGEAHRKMAIASVNMGIMYRQMKLFGDAITNFETAAAIWEKVYPNGHPAMALAQLNLGITYSQMGNYASAMGYYEKALKMYQASYGRKHSDIANTYNQIGLLQITQRQYEQGLQSYQRALIANAPSFNDTIRTANPASGSFLNGKVLLYSLRLKAEGLEARHYGKTLLFSDLRTAMSTLQVCDTLLDDLRHHSQDENDKIELGSTGADVYEAGVRIAHAMSEMRPDARPYREQAFYFAEKSKSAVLLSSIADAEAKSFAGIPAELLDQEKDIKASMALIQQLSSETAPDRVQQLRTQLFERKRDYQNFSQLLEKQYPEYFNLKFSKAAPTVAALQALLDDQTAVVSYFVAEKSGSLYTFVIQRGRFRVLRSTLPADMDRLVKGFGNSLYYSVTDGYQTASNTLSPLLLRGVPAMPHLIIIPSGRLSTLPFEALPTKELKGSFTFDQVPFLIERSAVRYSFSAGLLLHANPSTATSASQRILLCAPVTFPEGYQLNDLPGTAQEVKEIAGLFGDQAKVCMGAQASEQMLKSSDIGGYDIIHLATHGIVDELQPERSQVFLMPDGNEDGHLYAGEVFNLRLHANLATLSACQTGLGKYSKGEGVIGLSRGLLYAGARNILVSYWSVADQSTAQLMTKLYGEMKASSNPRLDESLRQAKLTLLKDPRYAAPYFWAPFVLIGQ